MFFESAGCVFQEVAQQNDFGKDAYIDLAEAGIVSPLCVAVQIKSGASFRAADGDYFIPFGRHAATWRESTVPVFGLVYDPNDRLLRWKDLTRYLRENPELEDGAVRIPRDAVLTESSLHGPFTAAIARYAVSGGPAVSLNLLSTLETLQRDAVFDAWALGRHDARYLILLRRLIPELQPDSTRRAIAALSHATPHPDIFWTKENWIPSEIEEVVRKSFRWSPSELAHMIGTLDVEDWGRGTLGQCLDMLIYQDPNDVAVVHAAIGLLLAAGSVDHALRAATVALSHSKDARAELALLLTDYPELRSSSSFGEIVRFVNDCGRFSLY